MSDVDIFRAGEYNFFFPDLGPNLLASKLIAKYTANPKENKLLQVTVSGFVASASDAQLIYDKLTDFGGTLVFETSTYVTYLMDDSSIVNVVVGAKNLDVNIRCWTPNEKLKDLIKGLEDKIVFKKKKDLVFSITQSGSDLSITSVGAAPSPLIVDNYHTEVIEDVNYVLDVFKKPNPSGRICILSGEPGTGKTHLIRSLLSQVEALFVIVPSNLISSLDSPSFLPMLLNAKNQYEQPIILIIEDGDACLVPRKSDNISTIASLLNLSDGILGSIIDIRIIISTNAEIREVDEAIKRPGRLCRQIHVGPLPYDQANKVYQRLTGDSNAKIAYRKLYTLAEIYYMANSDTVATAEVKTKKAIGFSSSYNQPDLTVNKLT